MRTLNHRKHKQARFRSSRSVIFSTLGMMARTPSSPNLLPEMTQRNQWGKTHDQQDIVLPRVDQTWKCMQHTSYNVATDITCKFRSCHKLWWSISSRNTLKVMRVGIMVYTRCSNVYEIHIYIYIYIYIYICVCVCVYAYKLWRMSIIVQGKLFSSSFPCLLTWPKFILIFRLHVAWLQAITKNTWDISLDQTNQDISWSFCILPKAIQKNPTYII